MTLLPYFPDFKLYTLSNAAYTELRFFCEPFLTRQGALFHKEQKRLVSVGVT